MDAGVDEVGREKGNGQEEGATMGEERGRRGGGNRWRRLCRVAACLLAIWLLGGCATGPAVSPPRASAEKGNGTGGGGRLLYGRGCVALSGDDAADRLAADQAARAEVAKQLEVKVTQLAEDVQREELGHGERRRSFAVSVRTREFVEKTLKGVKIENRFRDEERGMQCSVAVLDKGEMARRLRGEIEDACREIRTHQEHAGEADGAGRGVDALREETLAMLCAERKDLAAGLMRDLGRTPPSCPSWSELLEVWSRRVEGIRLEAVAGSGQRGVARRPLPEPLTVLATDASGRPLSNLPLKVLRAPDGAEVQAEAWTGVKGRASFRVYRVVSRGRPLEEIAVGIDWERLLGPALQAAGEEGERFEGWDTRTVLFTYRVPVPGDYRVGVAVFEFGTDRPLGGSVIQSSVLEGLQGAGFRTVDLFSSSLMDRRPANPEEARRMLGSRIDILVMGDVSLRFSSRTAGLTFYRARGRLQGIELASGRRLVTMDKEAKGGGLDDDRAARQALEKLAGKLEKALPPALEERLD